MFSKEFTEKQLRTENNIKININELTTDELKALSKILYNHGYMTETKEVNNRIIWIEN